MWELIPKIGTPIAVSAFLLGILLAGLRLYTTSRVERLKLIPPKDRLAAEHPKHGEYGLSMEGLEGQQGDLLLTALQHRAARFRMGAIVLVILAFIVAAVVVVSMWVDRGRVMPPTTRDAARSASLLEVEWAKRAMEIERLREDLRLLAALRQQRLREIEGVKANPSTPDLRRTLAHLSETLPHWRKIVEEEDAKNSNTREIAFLGVEEGRKIEAVFRTVFDFRVQLINSMLSSSEIAGHFNVLPSETPEILNQTLDRLTEINEHFMLQYLSNDHGQAYDWIAAALVETEKLDQLCLDDFKEARQAVRSYFMNSITLIDKSVEAKQQRLTGIESEFESINAEMRKVTQSQYSVTFRNSHWEVVGSDGRIYHSTNGWDEALATGGHFQGVADLNAAPGKH
jgi:hypothetical protein